MCFATNWKVIYTREEAIYMYDVDSVHVDLNPDYMIFWGRVDHKSSYLDKADLLVRFDCKSKDRYELIGGRRRGEETVTYPNEDLIYWKNIHTLTEKGIRDALVEQVCSHR